MNKMVRFTVSIIVTLVLVFMLTACNKKDSVDDETTSDITEAPTTAVTEDTTTDTNQTTDSTDNGATVDESSTEPVAEAEEDVFTNNLIKNPSFEDGADTRVHTDWQTDNEAVSYTEGGAVKTGSYHLTHWTDSGNYEVNTWQTVEAPNGFYNISAYVKASGTHDVIELSVKDYDGTNETVLPLENVSEYTKVVIENVEVKDGKLTVNFHSKGETDSDLYVEDVKVSPVVVAGQEAVLSTNLIKNPSFEDGADTRVHTDWQTDNEAVSYTEGGAVKTGSYHLTHWTDSGNYEVNTWQTVEAPNGFYNISAYVKASGTHDVIELSVKDYDGTNETVLPLENVSEYTKVVIGNVEVKDGKLTVNFHSKGAADSDLYVDDVEVTAAN